MHVRFWGTRGSIAKAGPHTVRYGGNTSCVEVRSASGTLIVLDCGTGAHGLGQALVDAAHRPIRGHLLISHTHWDHIQGLPFFAPLFEEDSEWDVCGPRGLGPSLHEILAGQMEYTYFPVTLDQLGAIIHYRDLVEGAFEIADVTVTTQYLNHPALTLGYRLEADGACVVYSSDHEPHSRRLAEGADAPAAGGDRRHQEFLTGADLVIHDAQYTAEEYSAKAGWGHSTIEYVVDCAVASGVRTLALYHHDPLRDDQAVDALLERARHRVAGVASAPEIVAAAEGMLLEVKGSAGPRRDAPASNASALAQPEPAVRAGAVLLASADAGRTSALAGAARADGLRVVHADDVDTAVARARSERPALAILDHDLPGGGGLAASRGIRQADAGGEGEMAVIVVVGDEDDIDAAAGESAGVTDWLPARSSDIYARTRIRAWLLRAACRWQPAPEPPDEDARLQALRALRVLDSPPEERFDRYTRLAAAALDVPIALVSLIDADRQWFKSRQGLDVPETPRETAFCAHAILDDAPLVVRDAMLDERFADNPLVTEAPYVRFYAGVPLAARDGSRVGTLCAMDRRPRDLSERELSVLRDLAALVEGELRAGTVDASGPR